MRRGAPWILAALLLVARPGGATTWRIQPDGGGDRPTIQAALSAATDGDVILLAAGRFRGPGNSDLDFGGRAVTLRSAEGAATCVLDLAEAADQAPRRAFVFRGGEGDGTRIVGITVAYGRAEGDGGAVLCSDGSPRFEACVFTGNQADRGGAVAVLGGRPSLTGCVFRQNTAEQGGAVFAAGGGIALEDCRFDNNAGKDAGALYLDAAPATGRRCVFTANLGYNGGAVSVAAGGDLDLTGCSFARNFGTLGGGIYATGATVRLEACVLAANTGGSGGGLLLARGARLVMTRSVIAFSPQGGAMALDRDSSVEVGCSLIYGNAEGDWSGVLAERLERDGNLRTDPRFADPARGDFSFAADSPCLADRPGCGPMISR